MQPFIAHNEEQGDNFLDCIVTGDKMWVFHYTPETQQQSMQWHYTDPPAKKFRTSKSTRKIMATVFCNRKGPLLVYFLPPGDTINPAAYCETLRRLCQTIQNKWQGKLTLGVCLLHGNVRPHTARVTGELLQTFKWDILGHPSHSPDLAVSDYHLFGKLKELIVRNK